MNTNTIAKTLTDGTYIYLFEQRKVYEMHDQGDTGSWRACTPLLTKYDISGGYVDQANMSVEDIRRTWKALKAKGFSEATPNYDIRIRAQSVFHTLFDNMTFYEAITFCEERCWEYIDENGFEWNLELVEASK